MTKGKSYNKIVFLTTLSVYLGLVLVGATPQVLAYAATTRSFDIRNEIELKDDLDNKPDNGEIEALSTGTFPELFLQLLGEIRNEVANGIIPVPLRPNFFVGGTFSENVRKNSSGALVSEQSLNKHLRNIVETSLSKEFRRKAFAYADYEGEWKTAKIVFEADSSDFLLKISFSKSKAEQFTEFLNREYSASAISAKNSLLKQVYENTKVTSENNQVFIVTRLPRGSIDSLPAKN